MYMNVLFKLRGTQIYRSILISMYKRLIHPSLLVTGYCLLVIAIKIQIVSIYIDR